MTKKLSHAVVVCAILTGSAFAEPRAPLGRPTKATQVTLGEDTILEYSNEKVVQYVIEDLDGAVKVVETSLGEEAIKRAFQVTDANFLTLAQDFRNTEAYLFGGPQYLYEVDNVVTNVAGVIFTNKVLKLTYDREWSSVGTATNAALAPALTYNTALTATNFANMNVNTGLSTNLFNAVAALVGLGKWKTQQTPSTNSPDYVEYKSYTDYMTYIDLFRQADANYTPIPHGLVFSFPDLLQKTFDALDQLGENLTYERDQQASLYYEVPIDDDDGYAIIDPANGQYQRLNVNRPVVIKFTASSMGPRYQVIHLWIRNTGHFIAWEGDNVRFDETSDVDLDSISGEMFARYQGTPWGTDWYEEVVVPRARVGDPGEDPPITPDAYVTATGGVMKEITQYGTNYMTHVFTSSGRFKVTGAITNGAVVDVMLVGGGGGGGSYGGGGGGAGGFKIYYNTPITKKSYEITVGAGGGAGTAGGATKAFSFTASGGGRGGNDREGGGSGACGGGGGRGEGGGSGTTKYFTAAGIGSVGGDGGRGWWHAGAGGGGITGDGASAAAYYKGCDGGAGVSSSFQHDIATDTNPIETAYCGGGGGSSGVSDGGLGGRGHSRGGNGGGWSGTTVVSPTSAANNSGSGGGGGVYGGASGGSGIVIIKYRLPQP